MTDTYSQIYIQIIFAVKNRDALIHKSWEEELYKYITGIVQNKGQKMLSINGTSNHIHILIGMKPTCCLSDLVREVKKSSNKFIREKKFTRFNFQWQEGFGAFSYGHSQLTDVIQYIEKQKNIIGRKALKKNIWHFWKLLKLNLRMNICSNGLMINDSGSGEERRVAIGLMPAASNVCRNNQFKENYSTPAGVE